MSVYIQGTPRGEQSLMPRCHDDFVDADSPVRALDAFVDTLDLPSLGFAMRDHGTVEELYRNLHNLLPATEAKLRAGRDEVDRNLALMTPLTTLPVDLDAVLARGVDVDAWDEALVGLGLGRAAATVRRALTDPGPPPAPPPPTEADAPVVERRRREFVPPATEGEQDALF